MEEVLKANDLKTGDQRTRARREELSELTALFREMRPMIDANNAAGGAGASAERPSWAEEVKTYHRRSIDALSGGVLTKPETQKPLRDSLVAANIKGFHHGTVAAEELEAALRTLQSLGIQTAGELMQQSLITLHRHGFSANMLGIITTALRQIDARARIGLESPSLMIPAGRRFVLPAGMVKKTKVEEITPLVAAVEQVPSVGRGNGVDFLHRLGLPTLEYLAEAHIYGILPRSGITAAEFKAIIDGAKAAKIDVGYRN